MVQVRNITCWDVEHVIPYPKVSPTSQVDAAVEHCGKAAMIILRHTLVLIGQCLATIRFTHLKTTMVHSGHKRMMLETLKHILVTHHQFNLAFSLILYRTAMRSITKIYSLPQPSHPIIFWSVCYWTSQLWIKERWIETSKQAVHPRLTLEKLVQHSFTWETKC